MNSHSSDHVQPYELNSKVLVFNWKPQKHSQNQLECEKIQYLQNINKKQQVSLI